MGDKVFFIKYTFITITYNPQKKKKITHHQHMPMHASGILKTVTLLEEDTQNPMVLTFHRFFLKVYSTFLH